MVPGVLPRGQASSCAGSGCGLDGSSPCLILWSGAGHTCPSPGPVALRTTCDHQTGGLVTCGGVAWGAGRFAPVLVAPRAGVGGVDRDQPQPGPVGGRLQPVTELSGGHPGDGAAEPFTAP